MENLCQKIRGCEDHWRELFAVSKPFNEKLIRWDNSRLRDQYTTNAFCSDVALSREDVQQTYDYQKEKKLDFLQFMCRVPMDRELADEFGLQEELVLTMTLQNGTEQWRENKNIVIRDVQTDKIADDIITFYLKQEEEALKQSDYAYRQILQDMDAAKVYPEYHWLAAYQDGKIVAICHVLCYGGCVEIDDLMVAPEARKQYIATTLLKYAAQQFEGIKYLHADDHGTAKNIYSRLGFVTVDRCWEYRRVWK